MFNKTFQLESFGLTDVGLVREHNEDVWAAYPTNRLFILADGMGGHSSGEIASKEAVNHLFTLFTSWHDSHIASIAETKMFFANALTQVNSWVYKKGLQDENLKGMGTTLCALFFHHKEAILAHVGDSRIYRLRNKQLELLTEDHSLIAELLALGAMSAQEAETFPYKHILTRAIGTQPKVEPSIASVEVEAGDLFMLCSDGLTNYLSHEQITEILEQDLSLPQLGQALVDLANRNGGGDNITLILIHTSPLFYDLP